MKHRNSSGTARMHHANNGLKKAQASAAKVKQMETSHVMCAGWCLTAKGTHRHRHRSEQPSEPRTKLRRQWRLRAPSREAKNHDRSNTKVRGGICILFPDGCDSMEMELFWIYIITFKGNSVSDSNIRLCLNAHTDASNPFPVIISPDFKLPIAICALRLGIDFAHKCFISHKTFRFFTI